jgi:hypothetical protein
MVKQYVGITRSWEDLRFRKLTLHCDGQQGGCLCFAVLILFGDGKAYLSEEADFSVSRTHLEITTANFLQLPEPNMGQSDSKEHLAKQLDILSSSIGQSRHLRRPQHIRQQEAHSGVIQILIPGHIRRSEDLKLGEEKGWCILLDERRLTQVNKVELSCVNLWYKAFWVEHWNLQSYLSKVSEGGVEHIEYDVGNSNMQLSLQWNIEIVEIKSGRPPKFHILR